MPTRSLDRQGRRSPLVGSALLVALLCAGPVAQAQAPGLGQAAAALAAHNSTPVARSLQQRLRVPVVKVRGRGEAARYVESLPPSFEVIFRPDASEYGHAHIRVGEMVYDLGGVRFARADPLSGATWLNREAYGFVFACDRQLQTQLQTTFGAKVRKILSGETKYQLKPWETPRPEGENCETFVVSTLHQLCPELGMYGPTRYAGAVGLARFCLSSPKLEAVTVYSQDDPAGRDDFVFRKLEAR